MSEGMGEYIVVGIIISIVVNIVLIKVGNLIRLLRRRREERNTPIPDAHPYHVPNTIPTHGSPRPTPAPLPAVNNNQNITASNDGRNRNGPPPIPARRVDMSHRDRDSFPRCPICRSSNRPGKTQKIFWDNAVSRWKCIEGHSFSS